MDEISDFHYNQKFQASLRCMHNGSNQHFTSKNIIEKLTLDIITRGYEILVPKIDC